jgi:predicted Zn-dependent protease
MKKITNVMMICAFLLTVSCGNKVNSGGVQSALKVQNTFLKGDPATIIAGSFLNNDSFITGDNVGDFQNFTLASVNQFTEKDLLVEQTDVSSNIEKGNEANDKDSTQNANKMLYRFRLKNNDYIYENSDIDLSFHFKIINNKLFLKELETKEFVYKVEDLHYSILKTKDAFSILIKANDDQVGRVLMSFVFTKKIEQIEIPKSNTYFKYVMGPGVKVNWDQNESLVVHICGANTNIENIYRTAINEWKSTLNHRLNFKVERPFSYPPYSDLNTHCIYTVKNYQTLYSENAANPGTTYTTPNKFTGKFIDSDIIIWEKENEKYGVGLELVPTLSRTITHEFGHLIGLDHQFTKGINSIMSYNRYDDYISYYDKSAINELYNIIP